LKDADTEEILFQSVAGVANWVDSFELNRLAKITVDTLESGTLFLYE
jgi:hypothetical protein